MEYYKNKVSWCPICDQGWIEIIKHKNTKELFVWCSECESCWEHPLSSSQKMKAGSIFATDGQIEEPTDPEIQLMKWSNYILKT
ncbi:hypothetical protein [Planomicrobium sp. CPCC 101079]|uniref:hypothetical protein n=1 Tax=Planomicrobium sp. CPCC 101079 TaxID=2599618 RepID=UPI0011B511E5|nr:hypothetical protein [Planomicrobium sp. CPCC 101079]TWT09297.1 hypothetical protein FQV28_06590 [Planomicrobium sp. CPCC 101079]